MGRKTDLRLAAGRRYWREGEARVVVEAWRSSGEGVAEFARRQGVAPRRLSRWVRRLQGARGRTVRFHPVRLVEAAAVGASIEIQLGGGRRVRVPRGFEMEDLRRVLAVLEEEKC